MVGCFNVHNTGFLISPRVLIQTKKSAETIKTAAFGLSVIVGIYVLLLTLKFENILILLGNSNGFHKPPFVPVRQFMSKSFNVERLKH